MHLVLEAEVHVSKVGEIVHWIATIVAARVTAHRSHSVVHGVHVLVVHWQREQSGVNTQAEESVMTGLVFHSYLGC